MKKINLLAIVLLTIQLNSASLVQAGHGGGHHGGGHHGGHGSGHHSGAHRGGNHHAQNRGHHQAYHGNHGHNRPYGHWRRYGDVGLGLGLGLGAAGLYGAWPVAGAPYATGTATPTSESSQSVSNTYINQPLPTNSSPAAETQSVYVLNNTPFVLFVQTDADEDTLEPGDSTDLNWTKERLISYTSPDDTQKGDAPIAKEKLELIVDKNGTVKAQ